MVLLRNIEQKPDAEIKIALDLAIADAEKTWNMTYDGEYPTSGFGLQELRPFNVENTTSNIPQTSNLNQWQTSQLTGSTWTDWINVTNNEDQYLVVTGIFNLDTTVQVTEIFPGANGQDLPVMNIEQLYALDVARAFFTKPFVVKPKSNITIQIYGATGVSANTSTAMGLLGYCLAKRARLIDKS